MLLSKINIFLLSFFLTYLAIFGIRNPDLENYHSLHKSFDGITFFIEPVLVVISGMSGVIGSLLGIDSLYVLYYIHICLILFFMFYALKIIIPSKIGVVLAFLTWLFSYGLMHGLIQIRFGLANSICVYVFACVFFLQEKKYFYKINTLSTLGLFSHYSTIFEFFVINFLKDKVFIIHLFLWVILCSFKFGVVYSVLPDFLMARFSGYMYQDLDIIPKEVSFISVVCYIVLMLSPKLNIPKLDMLRIYAALSFIPYFLIPEYEILVRLGVAFQYLLIPYFFLTFRFKKAFCTTILIFIFFSYKFYSFSNALGSYL